MLNLYRVCSSVFEHEAHKNECHYVIASSMIQALQAIQDRLTDALRILSVELVEEDVTVVYP